MVPTLTIAAVVTGAVIVCYLLYQFSNNPTASLKPASVRFNNLLTAVNKLGPSKIKTAVTFYQALAHHVLHHKTLFAYARTLPSYYRQHSHAGTNTPPRGSPVTSRGRAPGHTQLQLQYTRTTMHRSSTRWISRLISLHSHQTTGNY